MKRYEFTEEEIAEIKEASCKGYDAEIKKRLQALELRAEGRTNEEVAEATGFRPEYVTKLVGKFCKDGIERITTLRWHMAQKNSYPVLITKAECFVSVYVPDFDITVYGESEAVAVQRAQDVVSLWATRLRNPPDASEITMTGANSNTAVSEIEIDVTLYRDRPEAQLTFRSVAVPRWLDEEAKRAKLNFSRVLREALKRELFSAKDKE